MEKGSSPSLSSSPSHEFSFTISLHQSSSDDQRTFADDIFFGGHLLPLHFSSNLPVTPRASTTSLENLPPKPPKEDDLGDCKIARGSASFSIHRERTSSIPKAKSFSIFGWRRASDKEKPKRFDISDFVKRYAKLVFPGRTSRQSQSFSVSSRSFNNRKQCKGEFNSGPLLPTPSSSDSSMEELQAAIQAAIAHCKNSISADEASGLQL